MATEKTADHTLRSKTGWTRLEGNDIGWWVGCLESKGNVYFFATRITKQRSVQTLALENLVRQLPEKF